MINSEKVKGSVEKLLSDTSAFLVDVTVDADNNIVVTIDDDCSVDIEFCEKLHRAIESELDRNVEDYSLEVGSAGLTSPLLVARQYIKYIGSNVEILSLDGKKLQGVLKSADDLGFTVTVTKKEKPVGAKRKIDVEEDIAFLYTEVKYVKNLIIFK